MAFSTDFKFIVTKLIKHLVQTVAPVKKNVSTTKKSIKPQTVLTASVVVNV